MNRLANKVAIITGAGSGIGAATTELFCKQGAEDIVNYLESKLGIKVGQTTADGMFTLKTVECLAACGTAPVIQLGETYLENMNIEKVDKMLSDCRANVKEPISHWDKKHIKSVK